MRENEPQHGHGSPAEAEADRANVGAIGIFLAATAIALVVGAYLLWIWFQHENFSVNQAQVASRPSAELAQLRSYEQEKLGTAGVVDAQAGIYRVPVEKGIELFVTETKARRAAGEPQRIQPTAPPPAPAEGTPAEGAAPDQGTK